MKWQPIATVPKDGTWVLLYTPHERGHIWCGIWTDYGDGTGEFWSTGGANGGWEIGGMDEFTHWMLPPKPPRKGLIFEHHFTGLKPATSYRYVLYENGGSLTEMPSPDTKDSP